MAAAKRDTPADEDHGKTRLNQRKEDEMCEAHVTLGRLSHVKACHGETSEQMMRSLADAGAREAVEAAMAKGRSDYETLKENLEKLYRKSMADLHKRKMTVEAPTRARVELVAGQKKAADDAEKELKVLMANPNEGVLTRELPQALRRANKVLKASIKLIGLRLPEVKPVTVKDFPPGRLHNVIIAPRRSGQGQRDRAQPQPRPRTGGVRKRPPSTKPPRVTAAHEEGEAEEAHRERQSRPPIPLRSMSSSSPFSDNGDKLSSRSLPGSQSQSLASAASAVAPGDEAAAAAVAAGAAAAEAGIRGVAKSECCRNGQSIRHRGAPAGWDEKRGEELGDVGDAPLGVAAKACSHCACACRADDVRAAYRTLRKRYRALKDQADKEDVRARTEEQRKEMQAELDGQKYEMRAELDRKKLEMEAEFETRKRVMQANFNGKNGKVEPVAPAPAPAQAAAASSEGVLASSQTEVQSLREIVLASLGQSKAMQQELAELRHKVALGEECLQEALHEALSLRQEITKRKQHGEMLLALIRFLKGQMSAYANNADWGEGEEKWRGMGTAAPVRPKSDYGSSDSAIDYISPRSRANAGARQPKAAARHQRPRPRKSGTGASGDDALRHPAFRRSRSAADGHGTDGYPSPPGELRKPKAAARHQRPRRLDADIGASEDDALRYAAFPGSPSKADGHDTGGYQSPPGELPRAPDVAGGDNSWIERAGGAMSGLWTDWDRDMGRDGDGDGGEELGDAKARHLERERDHLTREVYKLNAQLEASGATSTSSRLGPSDLDEGLSSRSLATSASVPVDAPAPPTGTSRGRDEAAAAAAQAEEAAAVAVVAAEEVSKTEAAISRGDKKLRWQRGDDGDDNSGNVGNRRNRHRNYHDNAMPSLRRGCPPATSMSPSDDSADESDSDSISSGTSGGSRSDSPSWRSLARRQQQSFLAAETFSRLPQRQQQRQERREEAATAKARRMSGRATQAAARWGRSAEGSDSDTVSEKVLSEGSVSETSESPCSRNSGSLWF